MAFKIVKASVTFMLFVMSNLAVYCTHLSAEENKTTEQQWYLKVYFIVTCEDEFLKINVLTNFNLLYGQERV